MRVEAAISIGLLVAACGAPPTANDAAADDAGDVDAAVVVDAGSDAPDAPIGCVDPASGPPTDVFCIGLYLNHDRNQHDPSAIPYTPGYTLWSDGAEKQRYLYLPPGTTIDTTDMDAWVFPVGTRAFKEFRVGGQLVETRFLWKRTATSWVEATYIWSADGTTATLGDRTNGTILPSGYEIPSRRACGLCHNGASDTLLGVEAIELALPTTVGLTLSRLVADGRLSAPPATTSITLPEDATGHAADALGYMHANCGMPCHSARGVSSYTHFLARLRAEQFWPPSGGAAVTVETTDAYMTTVNVPVMLSTYSTAFPGQLMITPGAHDQSLVWSVAHLRGVRQMPPIVSHQIDMLGTQRIADWIDALPHP